MNFILWYKHKHKIHTHTHTVKCAAHLCVHFSMGSFQVFGLTALKRSGPGF